MLSIFYKTHTQGRALALMAVLLACIYIFKKNLPASD